jgi:hypothetical protein
MNISSVVSRCSAAYLLAGGAVTLFGADVVLPALVPGFPPSANFVGQMIAGAWLAMASVNWFNRSQVLGGIYGRPVVYANVVLWVVTGLGVVKSAMVPGASVWLWAVVVPAEVFAGVYGVLMFRGPFGVPAAK